MPRRLFYLRQYLITNSNAGAVKKKTFASSASIRMKGKRRKLAGQVEKISEFRQSIQPEPDKLLKLANGYEQETHQLATPQKYTLEVQKR